MSNVPPPPPPPPPGNVPPPPPPPPGHVPPPPPGIVAPPSAPAPGAHGMRAQGVPPQVIYVNPGISLPPGVQLSSLGRRFGASLLSVVLMIVTLVIGYLIWAIIAWSKSTTPAKQLLGMKVISAKTLRPATTGTMWMRQVVWALVVGVGSAVTFGILGLVDALMIFGGDKRQRLVDRMADTYVVDDPDDAWNLKSR